MSSGILRRSMSWSLGPASGYLLVQQLRLKRRTSHSAFTTNDLTGPLRLERPFFLAATIREARWSSARRVFGCNQNTTA